MGIDLDKSETQLLDEGINEEMEKTNFDVSLWKSIKEAIKELIENFGKKFSSKFGKKGKICKNDKTE